MLVNQTEVRRWHKIKAQTEVRRRHKIKAHDVERSIDSRGIEVKTFMEI